MNLRLRSFICILVASTSHAALGKSIVHTHGICTPIPQEISAHIWQRETHEKWIVLRVENPTRPIIFLAGGTRDADMNTLMEYLDRLHASKFGEGHLSAEIKIEPGPQNVCTFVTGSIH